MKTLSNALLLCVVWSIAVLGVLALTASMLAAAPVSITAVGTVSLRDREPRPGCPANGDMMRLEVAADVDPVTHVAYDSTQPAQLYWGDTLIYSGELREGRDGRHYTLPPSDWYMGGLVNDSFPFSALTWGNLHYAAMEGRACGFTEVIDWQWSPLLLPGDANSDGMFNSQDLVQIFQAGKYESREMAYWHEGNWQQQNNPWFDSGDLVAAFATGRYEQQAAVVPEPRTLALLLLAPILFARR